MENNGKATAEVFNISKLMTKNIGEEDAESKKAASDEALEEALSHKKKTTSFGFSKEDEEEEEEPKGSSEENEEEEEDPKGGSEEDEEDPKGGSDEDEEEEDSEEDSEEDEVDEETKAASDELKSSLKDIFGEDLGVIIQEDEEGNEVEVSLDDAILDKETFADIVKAKISQMEDDLKESHISKEGLSDFGERLLEVDKLGGDVSSLLETHKTITNPLSKLDTTTTEGKKAVIDMRLTATGQHSKADIGRLIKSYEQEGILDEMAETAETELKEAIDSQIKSAKTEAENKVKAHKELHSKYSKAIEKELDTLDLSSDVKKRIKKAATEVDDKGRFKIDDTYFAMRSNPEKAALFAILMEDENLFVKVLTNKVVQEKQLSTSRKVKLSKKAGAGNPGTKAKGKRDLGGKSEKGSVSLSALMKKGAETD